MRNWTGHLLSGRQFVIASLTFALSFGGAALFLPDVGMGHHVPTGYAVPVDEPTASRILGQRLPEPASAVPGLARRKLTATLVDPDMPAVPAMVHQIFAIQSRDIAVLTVFPGTLASSVFTEKVDLNGVSAFVTVRGLGDGSTSVGYRWAAHGLVYNLNIQLIAGLDRITADQIAASIP